jgi:O-antigen/teichoic acid export membrane protein
VVGHGVNVLTGPVGMVLVMTGHEKIMRNNVLAAGAVNIGLNLILVPKLGALGAAVATAVSLALVNGLSLVQVRRHVTGPAQLATREGRGG